MKDFTKKFLVTIIISLLIGFVLGYWLCWSQWQDHKFRAEKDLYELEMKFHTALANPHTFHIFNGQFEVYPVKGIDRRFNYKK